MTKTAATEMTTAQLAANVRTFVRNHSDLVHSYLAAKRTAEQTRAKIDAIIAPVFASFGFPVANASKIWTLDESHEAKVKEFYAACDVAHKAAGYDVPPGYCPALIAESNLSRHRRRIVETFSIIVLGISQEKVAFVKTSDWDRVVDAAIEAVRNFG